MQYRIDGSRAAHSDRHQSTSSGGEASVTRQVTGWPPAASLSGPHGFDNRTVFLSHTPVQVISMSYGSQKHANCSTPLSADHRRRAAKDDAQFRRNAACNGGGAAVVNYCIYELRLMQN